jgi:Predicted ATP-binding protein involved in virulence
MYIKKIQIQNNGPIDNLLIEPLFAANGNPFPLLLIGKNGSGKTLLLSNILDSFVELKKKVYTNMPEIDSNKLLKVGSTTYISPLKDYLYSNVKFTGINGQEFTYTDFATKINSTQFRTQHPNLTLDGINLASPSDYADGFYRKVIPSDKNIIKENTNSNILIYFPHSRYDHPEWLHNDAKIGFKVNKKYLGHTDDSIIKDHVIPEVITWLLDCMLDKYLYESTTRKEPVNINKEGKQETEIWTVLTETNGKNTIILRLLNQLLTSIYGLKFPEIEYARIGINQKERRQVAILVKERKKQEFEIAPTFSHLSSGEVMLLSLFGSIVREYDKIGVEFISFSDIKGIAVVDEIDLHLHIEHQKILLPELISMFPKVQFIISTHSPFFLLGMKEKFSKNLKLVSMPLGNEVEIDDFSEVKEAYNIFISGFDNFKKTHEQLKERIGALTKPLVITEGKTDWKHLKSALVKLQAQGKYVDIPEFDFLEFEDEIEMGSGNLKTYCLQRAKVANEKKIICIFDRDEANYVKEMNPPATEPLSAFRKHANNVYSFCIPKPSHRASHQYITIEHYYTDSELMTKDSNERRIYLSSEFSEKGKHKTEPNLRHGNYNKIKAYIEDDKSKVIEYDVFDENDTNIALPKSDFAQYILDNQQNFDQFDISQFETVFSILDSILKD